LKREDKLKIASFIYDEDGFLIKGAIDKWLIKEKLAKYFI